MTKLEGDDRDKVLLSSLIFLVEKYGEREATEDGELLAIKCSKSAIVEMNKYSYSIKRRIEKGEGDELFSILEITKKKLEEKQG